MRARRIIEGAAFGPEVIRTAIDAFEGAWSEIADRFDEASRDAGREVLATSIISAVRADTTNPIVLRGAGLRATARAFPDRFVSPLSGEKTEGEES
jgi:hypothetical protein